MQAVTHGVLGGGRRISREILADTKIVCLELCLQVLHLFDTVSGTELGAELLEEQGTGII